MDEVWNDYVDRIAGGWKCTSFELFESNNNALERKLIAKPHGETPLGRVIISRNGWLAAHVANPERMNAFSGKPWITAPDKEIAHVTRGTSMYCGYLKLFKDETGSLYWQTAVEVSSDPNRIGGIEERRVTLTEESGKRYMTLEPKQDTLLDNGTKARAVLKWEKFE